MELNLSLVAEMDDEECRRILAGAMAQESLLRAETELLKKYQTEADKMLDGISPSHVRLILIAVLNKNCTPMVALEQYQRIKKEDERRKLDAEKWGTVNGEL